MKDSKNAHPDPAPKPARKRLPVARPVSLATPLEESFYASRRRRAANH